MPLDAPVMTMTLFAIDRFFTRQLYKSREAAEWESLTAHMAALCERYARELGENAYAVFNVITEFASRPPANLSGLSDRPARRLA